MTKRSRIMAAILFLTLVFPLSGLSTSLNAQATPVVDIVKPTGTATEVPSATEEPGMEAPTDISTSTATDEPEFPAAESLLDATLQINNSTDPLIQVAVDGMVDIWVNSPISVELISTLTFFPNGSCTQPWVESLTLDGMAYGQSHTARYWLEWLAQQGGTNAFSVQGSGMNEPAVTSCRTVVIGADAPTSTYAPPTATPTKSPTIAPPGSTAFAFDKTTYQMPAGGSFTATLSILVGNRNEARSAVIGTDSSLLQFSSSSASVVADGGATCTISQQAPYVVLDFSSTDTGHCTVTSSWFVSVPDPDPYVRPVHLEAIEWIDGIGTLRANAEIFELTPTITPRNTATNTLVPPTNTPTDTPTNTSVPPTNTPPAGEASFAFDHPSYTLPVNGSFTAVLTITMTGSVDSRTVNVGALTSGDFASGLTVTSATASSSGGVSCSIAGYFSYYVGTSLAATAGGTCVITTTWTETNPQFKASWLKAVEIVDGFATVPAASTIVYDSIETETPTSSATSTATNTPTETPTNTLTTTPTNTATSTSTQTPTATPVLPTQTPINTPTASSETGAVIVHVETSDGRDLPDDLTVCLDEDCRPLNEIAGIGMLAMHLPSGSGAVFSDIPAGRYAVSARDPQGTVLVTQDVIVPAGESVTVRLVLPSPTRAKTMPAITGLPNTGNGPGAPQSEGFPASVAWLLCAMLLGWSIVAAHRRNQKQ